jgi:putative oxidoreductase
MAQSRSILLGRFLLGLYFLLPGIAKFADPSLHLEMMDAHGVAPALWLLWIAGAANLVAGVSLITGRHVRLVAYGCILYILLVNLMLHDFWNFEGATAERELQNFVKNLGILAGLLVLAGSSPKRRLALQTWWQRDSRVASG